MEGRRAGGWVKGVAAAMTMLGPGGLVGGWAVPIIVGLISWVGETKVEHRAGWTKHWLDGRRAQD